MCEWQGGHDLSVINCYFVFFPLVLLPIIQEPLGKQELIVNQSLMWDLQSPRKQNCFSLILHVFELRKQSLWTWLLGEPCYLAWLSQKGRSRRNKRKRCMSTSTHITGSHNNHLKKLIKKCKKKEKKRNFHAALHAVSMHKKAATNVGHVLLKRNVWGTFLHIFSYVMLNTHV